jgi:hypothetical protein
MVLLTLNSLSIRLLKTAVQFALVIVSFARSYRKFSLRLPSASAISPIPVFGFHIVRKPTLWFGVN